MITTMATASEGLNGTIPTCSYGNKVNPEESNEQSILTNNPKDLTFLAVTCQPGQVASLEQPVSVLEFGSGSGAGAGKDDDADCFMMTMCCSVCCLACCAVCSGTITITKA